MGAMSSLSDNTCYRKFALGEPQKRQSCKFPPILAGFSCCIATFDKVVPALMVRQRMTEEGEETSWWDASGCGWGPEALTRGYTS